MLLHIHGSAKKVSGGRKFMIFAGFSLDFWNVPHSSQDMRHASNPFPFRSYKAHSRLRYGSIGRSVGRQAASFWSMTRNFAHARPMHPHASTRGEWLLLNWRAAYSEEVAEGIVCEVIGKIIYVDIAVRGVDAGGRRRARRRCHDGGNRDGLCIKRKLPKLWRDPMSSSLCRKSVNKTW